MTNPIPCEMCGEPTPPEDLEEGLCRQCTVDAEWDAFNLGVYEL